MAETIIATPRQAGIYVRKQREHLDLTRAQLAQQSGASERLIASLELGDATGIRLDKLLAILGALDLSLHIQPRETKSAGMAVSHSSNGGHRKSAVEECPSAPPSYDDLYRSFVARQGVALRDAQTKGAEANGSTEAVE